ncbi:MAG: hypothetical protein PHC94_04545 [Methylobacter sp.]|nr:hypothetical protein [Methylococcales bacterium]MDD5113261.1 hypothetical protein [Methylobacter sp.]
MNQYSAICILLCGLLFSGFAWAVDDTPIKKVVVKEIVPINNQVGLVFMGSTEPSIVVDQQAASLIGQIDKGDRLTVLIDDKNTPHVIKQLKAVEKPVSKRVRIITLLMAAGVLLVFALIASKNKITRFVIGADNRYSNSKTQVVIWFCTLMVVYIATLGLRVVVYGWDFFGGVGITENLLMLSGLSALTYGAAKAVTVQQEQTAEAGMTGQKTRAQNPSFPNDLFENDAGELDLGDSQMFFVTVLSAVVFLLTAFHFLSWIEYANDIYLPDIDSTLLSSFGLGQGAYLIKKVATPLGK